MQVTLGIDLGGTKTDIGVVDVSGKILRRELIKTSKEGPHAVVQDLLAAISRLKNSSEEILGIGIGMAGQIDRSSGDVLFAPNLGWKNFPLAAELHKNLNIPVYVTNDVRAAAWGEWLYGAGRGCEDLICLFVGTGIGAGIVSGGKIMLGSCNTAGEVGHMTIDLKGPKCSCGNTGCFEALASGWAIASKAKEAVAHDPVAGKAFLDLVGGTIDEVNARKIFEAYRLKSSFAIKIVEEVREALVAGISGLVNAFNPSKVILGGGVITGFPEFIEMIREGVPKRALKAPVACLEIAQAQLKGDAGVIGAAAFAQQEVAG